MAEHNVSERTLRTLRIERLIALYKLPKEFLTDHDVNQIKSIEAYLGIEQGHILDVAAEMYLERIRIHEEFELSSDDHYSRELTRLCSKPDRTSDEQACVDSIVARFDRTSELAKYSSHDPAGIE